MSDAPPTQWPRPPDKPHPLECCNRGCCPCIFDYYWDALDRWETRILEGGGNVNAILASFDHPEAGKR
jgi:hypothetical protein